MTTQYVVYDSTSKTAVRITAATDQREAEQIAQQRQQNGYIAWVYPFTEPETEPDQVKIRWLDVTPAMQSLSGRLRMNGAELGNLKWKALQQLGIARDDRFSPLQAWVKAMHEENGLCWREPAHPHIVAAVLEQPTARFMWWLA